MNLYMNAFYNFIMEKFGSKIALDLELEMNIDFTIPYNDFNSTPVSLLTSILILWSYL
jgi:hypothetical protein